MLFARYGRSHFLKDARRLGLRSPQAITPATLRRRRDRLILVHHPDHGGDANKAAEINAIYARMSKWLERGGQAASWGSRLRERSAKLSAFALAAAATYAALRRGAGRR